MRKLVPGEKERQQNLSPDRWTTYLSVLSLDSKPYGTNQPCMLSRGCPINPASTVLGSTAQNVLQAKQPVDFDSRPPRAHRMRSRELITG
jgi:hypothetical protein